MVNTFEAIKQQARGALMDCLEQRHTVWINTDLPVCTQEGSPYLRGEEIETAYQRLQRFRPLLAAVFSSAHMEPVGILSPISNVDDLYQALCSHMGCCSPGTMYLKRDDSLPVGGSVKMQGALYHMLCLACGIAQMHLGFDPDGDDPLRLLSPECRSLFQSYSIHVASTGNLGISIGSCAAALGFHGYVHMSEDAADWKRALLRQHGVYVVEYDGPYEEAEIGCYAAAAKDSHGIVVRDDSREFLLGYAAGVLPLKAQLSAQNIEISQKQPLFVYLPCGGGGAPTGISLGLKLLFGRDVHIFYCEPVLASCMLLGMASGLYEEISLADVGLSSDTLAEGLSVNRPSKHMGMASQSLVSGIITIPDARLLSDLRTLYRCHSIFIEPAAALSLSAPVQFLLSEAGRQYLQQRQLSPETQAFVHLAWATGGGLIPEPLRKSYLAL